jgi:O-antigen/teichoic acid export membrane protein
MLPILTRLLSTDQYGTLDVLSTLGSATISILTIGLDVAIVRMVADRPPGARRQGLFGSYYLLAAVVSIPVGLSMIVLAPWASSVLFGSDELAPAVRVVGAIVIAGSFEVVALNVMRSLDRARAYAWLSAGVLAVHALLAVLLLTRWRQDATAVLVALALSLAGGAVVGAVALRRVIAGRPNLDSIRALLALGLPAAPAVALTFFADFLNRAILLAAGGATQVAFLSVSLRFGSVAALVVVGFQLAWQPRAYRIAKHPSGSIVLGNEARRILALIAATAFAIGLTAPELVPLVAGQAYVSAVPVVGLALVATIGTALFLLGSTASIIDGTTRHLSMATAAGVIVGLGANWILAPGIGALGTAAAAALGQWTAAVTAVALSREGRRVEASWSRIFALSIGTSVGILVATMVPADMSNLGRLISIIGFVGLLGLEGTAGEVRSAVNSWVRALWNRT